MKNQNESAKSTSTCSACQKSPIEPAVYVISQVFSGVVLLVQGLV